MVNKGKGWHGESGRHSLAARGIKTVPKKGDKHVRVTFSWYEKSTEGGKEVWEGQIQSNGKFVGELRILALRGDGIERGREILIEEIYIAMEARYRRFGTSAVSELKRRFDRIQASTRGTSEARDFWRKMGFKEIERNFWEWRR